MPPTPEQYFPEQMPSPWQEEIPFVHRLDLFKLFSCIGVNECLQVLWNVLAAWGYDLRKKVTLSKVSLNAFGHPIIKIIAVIALQ